MRSPHKNERVPKDFPSNFPLVPEKFYKDVWNDNGGWSGFLGTEYIANNKRVYLAFDEVKRFVKVLNFKGKNEWFLFSKSVNKPHNIPSAVNSVYKSEWKGWADFLGKE